MADSGTPSASTKETVKRRGATRHCCYGLCNSDSRYSDRDYMKDVQWIPFPKPKKNLEKSQRWVRSCGRENFTVDRVTRWTYICSKHFVGGNGPTVDHPDPVPATHTPNQVERFSKKRKAPTPRGKPVTKRLLLEVSEAMLSLQNGQQTASAQLPKTLQDASDYQVFDPQIPTKTNTEIEFLKAIPICNAGTQTTFSCKDALANKIERRLKKSSSDVEKPRFVNKFHYDNIKNNEKLFKFYTGVTVQQFNHLYSCLGDSVNNLIYWQGSRTRKTKKNKNCSSQKKISTKNQMLLTLMKIRQNFPNKDLAYRFGVSQSTISITINTWIQFLFKMTAGIRKRMFPSRLLIKEHLPACFKSFKNVRIIIDCFEIFVQSSRDFAEQGNVYSSYKNHATLKCLVGISPTGGISFLSDVYEGSISDKDIFIRSGLVNLLEPGDLVIADRGFLIKDVLMPHKVDLNIPPFLCGRDRLTAQEEILTKRIARVRIHVERAIERMKKFKIIGNTLSLSLKPVIGQIVQIIGFLVNYQEPLVK